MPYADAYGVRTETSCDDWYCRQLWRHAGTGCEGGTLRSGPRAKRAEASEDADVVLSARLVAPQ